MGEREADVPHVAMRCLLSNALRKLGRKGEPGRLSSGLSPDFTPSLRAALCSVGGSGLRKMSRSSRPRPGLLPHSPTPTPPPTLGLAPLRFGRNGLLTHSARGRGPEPPPSAQAGFHIAPLLGGAAGTSPARLCPGHPASSCHPPPRPGWVSPCRMPRPTARPWLSGQGQTSARAPHLQVSSLIPAPWTSGR